MLTAKPKLIDFAHERSKRGFTDHDPNYQRYVNGLSRMELLEEMVSYQEDHSKQGELSFIMKVRGKILFSALERNAETDDFRTLVSCYRRHLEDEIEKSLRGMAK